MQIKSFYSQFPHHSAHDKCQMAFSEQGMVAYFDLIDSYCLDPACDCRRVSLAVVGDKITYATISYGWETPSFYYKWGFDKEMAHLLTEGSLDPWAEQTEFAHVFLEPFSMMIKDPNFTDRLKKHYAMFKKAISANAPPSQSEPNKVISLKAKHR